MVDKPLQSKIDEWLKWDENPETRNVIENLTKEGKYQELKTRLMDRMEFGTAGLRSRMGAGYSMMNDLTIIQTGQGFLEYLKKQFDQKLNQKGVIIGHDARHNSSRFARLTANIFLRAGIPVYLFRQITPTPFISYGILKYKCCAGVMITASHNPKEDNGYKVYLDNGAQIIPPHDTLIAESILANLEPRKESWNVENVETHSLRIDPFNEIFSSYFDDLKKHCHFSELNSKTPLVFTYTAMHGVGYQFAVESFKAFNLKPFISVKEQIEPDPDFPTVKFPNPEEGKSSLNLAIKTANQNKSTIILANDPDADRLAVAEKDENGEWKIFNGNEIGALLGWWMWENFKRTHKSSFENNCNFAKQVYMLYSTVSSQILSSIAKVEGFNCEDTLTGFKWMGNRAFSLIQQNKHVLFSFEEAIGFMCGVNVLDKDGISSQSIIAELAVYLNHYENKTLSQKLEWIYDKYGYHVSNNSYFLSYNQNDIRTMFKKLRNFDSEGGSERFSYPKKCGKYKIDKIRDLTYGVTVDFKNGGVISKTELPSSIASEMITFYFENGCVLTIRTSGTEPKIKWYSEIKQLEKSKSKEGIREELEDLVNCMISEFYQPEKNNFIPRSN